MLRTISNHNCGETVAVRPSSSLGNPPRNSPRRVSPEKSGPDPPSGPFLLLAPIWVQIRSGDLRLAATKPLL